MPTLVTKVIDPGGGAGVDYTTLAAWIAGCASTYPSGLVVGDAIWQGVPKNAATALTVSSGSSLTVSGITQDATRYVELTTNGTSSFRDNASVQSNALRFNASNGCSLTSTSNYSTVVDLQSNYTRISNWQIARTTGYGGPVALSVTGQNCDANNLIVESNKGGSFAGAVKVEAAGSKLRNSLVVLRAASQACIVSAGTGSSGFYFCTFAVPSDLAAASNAIDGAYGTPVFENCAFYGCTAVKTGGNTPTYTTCYTDVGSPPSGCTTAAYSTSSGAFFQNITDATRDYRIQSGSAFIAANTSDSTNGATDIAGTARPQSSNWDAGCWEYVSAGAPSLALQSRFVKQAINRSYTY